MIVKDEAPTIRRCLDSVRSLIDYWCVVDTGSTDDTREIIREHLRDLPGGLHERPWVNFGHNRNEALTLAREAAPPGAWLLLLDADETWFVEPDCGPIGDLSSGGHGRPPNDGYYVTKRLGDIAYGFLGLLNASTPWRFDGATHEALVCDVPTTTAMLGGWEIVEHADSSRRRSGNKFRDDIDLLAAAPRTPRNVFYLAQSYRDAGDLNLARDFYDERAGMGGFEEERWHALLQIARLTEQLGEPPDAAYLRAYEARPTRAEPLVDLARIYRERGQHAVAYLYASHACITPMPPDLLFVERSAYEWRATDELSIAAYWTGRRPESAKLCKTLLGSSVLPAEQRSRVAKNLAFANG